MDKTDKKFYIGLTLAVIVGACAIIYYKANYDNRDNSPDKQRNTPSLEHSLEQTNPNKYKNEISQYIQGGE